MRTPRAAVAVATLAIGGLLLVVTASRRLLYFPQRQDVAAATDAARRIGLAPWTEEGRFLGWRSTRAPPAPRALALFDARRGPKRLWLDPAATHNTIRYDARDPRWREVLEFVLGAGADRITHRGAAAPGRGDSAAGEWRCRGLGASLR